MCRSKVEVHACTSVVGFSDVEFEHWQHYWLAVVLCCCCFLGTSYVQRACFMCRLCVDRLCVYCLSLSHWETTVVGCVHSYWTCEGVMWNLILWRRKARMKWNYRRYKKRQVRFCHEPVWFRTHTHTCTQSFTHSLSHTHAHTHARAHTHTQMQAHTQANTHTHTRTLPHSLHARAHTHTCARKSVL